MSAHFKRTYKLVFFYLHRVVISSCLLVYLPSQLFVSHARFQHSFLDANAAIETRDKFTCVKGDKGRTILFLNTYISLSVEK